jgi:hypothetical protein
MVDTKGWSRARMLEHVSQFLEQAGLA